MAFNYDKLCGRIREFFKTQDRFAKALGMGCSSLNKRLTNKLEFTSGEIFLACQLLQIEKEEIPTYFFTISVRKTEVFG